MESFVGRSAELRTLEEEFELAKSGAPRTVLVTGPPGMGKSALVQRLVDQAPASSVVRAGADEAEARLSCGLVNQLFAGSGSPVAGAVDACGDPLAVGAELLRMLGELDARGPVLVVVEDLHWADAHSVQALTFALRRLRVDPVLAVLTARDDGEALAEGLRRLVSERGTVLRLGGLSSEELGKLAARLRAGPLPQPALERLRAHTDGNPLHARALLEELPPHVLARRDRPLPAPRSFALLVLSRLAACSERARRLVEAASVLGTRADLGLISRVAGLDDPASPLDEVVAAGLLTVSETPVAVVAAFPHAMVRAAVYDNLGRARRSALHGAAAGLLAGAPALDHRAAAALVHDAALAAELAAHAARENAAGDPLAAARHLLSAARLDPDASARERHVLDAAELLLAAGDVMAAKDLSGQLAELSQTPRRDYVLGHLALREGRQREAEQLLTGAWERAHPVADADLRTIASEQLADLCGSQVRPEEAITWARRALEHDLGDHRGASALTTLVVYLALVGRPGEALPLVEAIALDGANSPPRAVAGVLGRGIVRTWTGDLRPARTDLEGVLEATRRVPASRPGLTALGFLAQVEYLLGCWRDSLRRATFAVSLAADSGQTALLPLLHATAVQVLAARGDWNEAEKHVRAAAQAAEAGGDDLSLAYAGDAEARLAFCREEPERVVEVGRRLSLLEGQAVVAEPSVLVWRELWADALVALRRFDEAAAVVAEWEAHVARRPRRRLAHAAVARVRGNLDTARGDMAAAQRAFDDGLLRHQTLEAPFERAVLLLSYGQALRRAGERRQASARLREAEEAFLALESRPFAARAGRELSACGLTPRQRSGPRVELTPQELAVANLVAEGRTNREVSDVLVVSPKTVEYHLGNIFTKLGITSRRQVRAHLDGRPR